MTSRQALANSLKDAMRSGDEAAKVALRMALSSIKLAEVQKRGELDESEVASILQKEIRARHESIADAEKAGRLDLVRTEQAQLTVLAGFLPRQLSPDEIEALARQVIEKTQAASPADIGKVMKELQPQVKGLADGKVVSETVRRLLAQR